LDIIWRKKGKKTVKMLNQRTFASANVLYKIKIYQREKETTRGGRRAYEMEQNKITSQERLPPGNEDSDLSEFSLKRGAGKAVCWGKRELHRQLRGRRSHPLRC